MNKQSQLEKLIAEFCPDGVEYKRLDDVCEFIKGKGLSKNVKGLGDVPIILYGELYTTYGNYITDVVSTTSKKHVVFSPIIKQGDLVLPISSTTKEAQIGKASAYMANKPVYLGGDAILLRHNQNAGYLVYTLNGQWFEKLKMQCVFGTTISHLHPDKLAKINIPIPPLPVQDEIVRILDTFTALEAELEKELEARTKQYEYYRDELFSISGDNVPIELLSDLVTIGDGLHGTPNYDESGDYYFINGNNLIDGHLEFFYGTKKVGEDSYKKHGIKFSSDKTIFMSINGTIGSVSLYNNEKIVLGKSVAYFNVKSHKLTKKYLYYFLQTNFSKAYYEKSLTGSTIKNLGLKALRNYGIPLPPLLVQEEIVAILDRFEALVSDLKEGLPAEIALRRKQYEYYRGKLLSFC